MTVPVQRGDIPGPVDVQHLLLQFDDLTRTGRIVGHYRLDPGQCRLGLGLRRERQRRFQAVVLGRFGSLNIRAAFFDFLARDRHPDGTVGKSHIAKQGLGRSSMIGNLLLHIGITVGFVDRSLRPHLIDDHTTRQQDA